MLKTCTKCGVEQSTANYNKLRDGLNGLHPMCKSCHSKYKAKYYIANRKRLIEKQRKRQLTLDPEKEKLRLAKYHDIGRLTAWNKANPARRAAHVANRRAMKRNATPSWANLFFIEEIYDLAARRTKMLGVKFEVDHIIPLKGKLVCGLHVEHNLQIMARSDNIKKGNRIECRH